MLSAGSIAPDFEAHLSDGASFHLYEALTSAAIVLYFYPKDFTAGCTIEAKLFRDGYGKISALGARLVGVSRDSDESHTAFREACALPFPLLSDKERSIARLFGAEWPGGLGTRRVTYIIDRRRIIRGVFHHELRIGKHLSEALELLRTIRHEDHY